jgi:hypothetical protein
LALRALYLCAMRPMWGRDFSPGRAAGTEVPAPQMLVRAEWCKAGAPAS